MFVQVIFLDVPIPNPAAAGLSPAAPMVLTKWLGEARRLEAIGRRRLEDPFGSVMPPCAGVN